MDLVKLLNELVANIAALQAQLVDAQASADALAKLKYDEGFAAGVASVVAPPSDKIYSQAELDQKIADALLPIQAELEAVKASIEPKVAEALAVFKADLLSKYQEQQVVESQLETGFADLLK